MENKSHAQVAGFSKFVSTKEGPINKCFEIMSLNERAHTSQLFRAAYFLVKTNQSFRVFPSLLELEELE